MSQNPNENPNPENSEFDQSEALRRAILKLKEQGMLTHVPDELIEKAEDKTAEKISQAVPTATPTAISQVSPEEVTRPAMAKPQIPTIATSSDDVEKHAEERAVWAAAMAGWDDTPSKAAPKAEVSVVLEPVVEEQIKKQEAPVAPIIEDKIKTQESQQIHTISPDDWNTKSESKKDLGSEEMAITLTRKEIKPQAENALTSSREQTPWILQQFFDGEIDLDQELSKRFPTVPLMSSVKFRTLGSRSGRKVATLMTQDSNAQLIIDADIENKVIQLSFNYGSMMTLRYSLSGLSDTDRSRWLELMQREQGGLAFLWGTERWQEDYLICIARKLGTNIYAFSPRNFESAIRLTPPVTKELLTWLDEIWKFKPEPPADDEAPLLTW